MRYARLLGWLGPVLVTTGCSLEPAAPPPSAESNDRDSVTNAVEKEPSLPPGVQVHGRLDRSDLTAILRLIGYGAEVSDVLSISVEQSGEVVVKTGKIIDPEAGLGCHIRLRKIDGKWKIVSTTMWKA